MVGFSNGFWVKLKVFNLCFSFFDNVARTANPSYIPTNDDILHARVRTTGVSEARFTVNNMIFRVVDVGGQRSERKKWIGCFENVDAIMFLIAISEYDQQLFEDPTENRMVEALTLFNSICKSKWFLQTSIILFLNKTDIFREKLATSPMSKYFPDYSGMAHFKFAHIIVNPIVLLNASCLMVKE